MSRKHVGAQRKQHRIQWALTVVGGLVFCGLVGCGSKKAANGKPVANSAGTGTNAVASGNKKDGANKDDVKPPTPAPTKKPDAKANAQSDAEAKFHAIVEKLADRDSATRQSAAQQLAAAGEELETKLIQALKADNAAVRRGAAFYLLGRFDQSNVEMVEGFVGLLGDSESKVVQLAIQSLQRLDNERLTAALPAVAELLQSESASIDNRIQATRLLSMRARQSRPALAELHKLLSSEANATLRKACMMAISRVDKRKNSARAFVKIALSDTDMMLRVQAVDLIGSFGSIIPESAPALRKLLEHDNEELSDHAAAGLHRIGKEALPELQTALSSEVARARRLALVALGEMGTDARDALPAIRKLIDDPEKDIRDLVKAAVKRINP